MNKNSAQVWDTIAPSYEDEIFSVFASDKKKKVKEFVKKNANKEKFAIDFGCGIGYALSLLSPAFKNVLAVDISQKCINKAKTIGYQNVKFKKVDLTASKIDVPSADFAFCCNVAILGNKDKSYSIIENVLNSLKKDGVAVFVLPSFESASFATWRLIHWYNTENVQVSDIPRNDLGYLNVDKKLIFEGIANIQDTPTKHYLMTEIYSLFNTNKFSLKSVDRVEYDWNTEFNLPPKWMTDPYPWDWIVEVKRVK